MSSPVRYHEGGFPPSDLEWARLIPLLGPTSAAIARYDGLLAAIPNPDVLLSPLTTQEAVLSSRIEGTQATMGEVLEFEAGGEAASPDRREDIQEILNYRAAMREAERLLQELPLSQRIVREAHRTLMSGVRGHGKAPGEYRRIPNWIGRPGKPIEEARFVPIDAARLPEAMGAWEKYAHADAPDRLVQLAILHAEFEALHPFLDGNGRLGRMLIPLFMWQAGLIRRPIFYISAYFEARRDEYYDGLLATSRDGDWTGWCRFFLDAVRVQAEDNLARAQGILDLYQDLKRQVAELTRSQYAIHALDWIFQKPVFRSSDFIAAGGIPAPTARRVLKVLTDDGILLCVSPGRGRSPGVYAFPELVNRAEGRPVFEPGST
ncbi:MAG TPA: Fic family protein [Longimicrobiales bacterium]|nr:Fic family protein [Longimicrobiales bacterium]